MSNVVASDFDCLKSCILEQVCEGLQGWTIQFTEQQPSPCHHSVAKIVFWVSTMLTLDLAVRWSQDNIDIKSFSNFLI